MNDMSRQLVSNLTHRRFVDPITFAKRRTEFLIERPVVPVEPVSVKKER